MQDDKSPLHYAAFFNREHIGRLLVRHGASLHARNKIGLLTPAHVATVQVCEIASL